MGANIELRQYKYYENGVLQVEEIHSRSEGESMTGSESESGKNPSESQKLESRKSESQKSESLKVKSRKSESRKSESLKVKSRKSESRKSEVQYAVGNWQFCSLQYAVRLRGWFIFPFLFLLVLPIRLMPNLLVDLEQVH